jgi:hypothetical protein
MKTKQLIKELMEKDPSGELEVSTSYGDIYYVDRLPAYYDGKMETLIWDESNSDNRVYKGMRISAEGEKLKLKLFSLEDAIWDQEQPGDLKIEYDSEHTKELSKDYVAKLENDFKDYVNKNKGKD